MKEGPIISTIAALIGDPARANMLVALMDGRALTVTELASAASVALPTASGHLSKLEQGRLLVAEKQGRHRYFRLSDPDVGEAIEKLMGVAQRTGAVRTRTGPRNQAMRTARVCYDHMAGERGVALLDALRRSKHLVGEERLSVTASGRRFFAGLGIDMDELEKGRRPVCRTCLDWSERRSHLAGALGQALLQSTVARGWALRSESRVLVFTPSGERAFAETFSL